MSTTITTLADDRKAGMTLPELALAIQRALREDCEGSVRVTVGWRGQIQSIAFEKPDLGTAN